MLPVGRAKVEDVPISRWPPESNVISPLVHEIAPVVCTLPVILPAEDGLKIAVWTTPLNPSNPPYQKREEMMKLLLVFPVTAAVPETVKDTEDIELSANVQTPTPPQETATPVKVLPVAESVPLTVRDPCEKMLEVAVSDAEPTTVQLEPVEVTPVGVNEPLLWYTAVFVKVVALDVVVVPPCTLIMPPAN